MNKAEVKVKVDAGEVRLAVRFSLARYEAWGLIANASVASPKSIKAGITFRLLCATHFDQLLIKSAVLSYSTISVCIE